MKWAVPDAESKFKEVKVVMEMVCCQQSIEVAMDGCNLGVRAQDMDV